MVFKALRILLASVILITTVANVWFLVENWSMENKPRWEQNVEYRGKREMKEINLDTSFVEDDIDMDIQVHSSKEEASVVVDGKVVNAQHHTFL